jgi:hypothetical protein
LLQVLDKADLARVRGTATETVAEGDREFGGEEGWGKAARRPWWVRAEEHDPLRWRTGSGVLSFRQRTTVSARIRFP